MLQQRQGGGGMSKKANKKQTVRPLSRPAPSIVLVRTSDIEPERIRWLWPGIIARGKITGLVGYPGLGKSQVAIDLASTVSTGRRWPGGAANGDAGDVIILAAEDDAADTLVPRLIAAGANLTNVHVVKAVKGDDGVDRAFNLAVDLDRLEKEYDPQRVRLLVVDPVSAYLAHLMHAKHELKANFCKTRSSVSARVSSAD